MAHVEERVSASTGVASFRVSWREGSRKQQQTWRTRDDAEAFAKRVEAYGNHWPPGEDPRRPASVPSMTFAEWAAVAVEQRTRASAGTRSKYLRHLEHHLNPHFGHLAVDAISSGDVAAWVAALRSSTYQATPRSAPGPLADKTLRNLHGFASSLMSDAMSQQPPLATRNPFARTLPPTTTVHTEDMVMLTPGEFASVLRWVPEQYRALIRLLAGTGLRFGEASALTVADVDLLAARKTLTVTKAWKRVDSKNYEVGEPKTPRSRRTISLSAELVDLLIPLVAAKRGSDLLFTDAHGQRLPHIEVWKRGWAPAVARARVCDQHYEQQREVRPARMRGRPFLNPQPCNCDGVIQKTPTLHGLRHSHASWLIAAGLPLPAISRRLGHSSIAITVDRYGHLDPAMDVDINAAVDAALASR